MSEFQVSFAWVEGEATFAFTRSAEPGPLELKKIGTLAEVKKTTIHVLEEKDAFSRAVAVENLADRARALEPLLGSDRGIRWRTLTELEKLGAAALSVLRATVHDSSRAEEVRARCIKDLARFGGDEMEAELMKIVEDETTLLKDGKKCDHDVLVAAVGGLERFRSHDCETVVVALRDLWATKQPVTDNLSLACDAVLQHLAGEPKLKPRK